MSVLEGKERPWPWSVKGFWRFSIKASRTPALPELSPLKKTPGAREQQARGAGSASQWFSFLPQLVAKEDPGALAAALSWDAEKTVTVQQACNQELSLRLQQVQSLRSLRNLSARKSSLPGERQEPKRARQDPT